MLKQIVDILIESMCLVEEKLSPEEIEAAGYYFGWSNLGMMKPYDKKMFKDLIEKSDWNGIVKEVHGQAQSNAEDDEMYDGMMKEIKHWVSLMKRDKTTKEMWNKEKSKE